MNRVRQIHLNRQLFNAVKKNDVVEQIEKLIEDGADVNEPNNEGNTPLHLATYNGKKDIVEALVDKWANVNEQNKKGQTPLHLVLEKKQIDMEVLGALLEKGEINVRAYPQTRKGIVYEF